MSWFIISVAVTKLYDCSRSLAVTYNNHSIISQKWCMTETWLLHFGRRAQWTNTELASSVVHGNTMPQ